MLNPIVPWSSGFQLSHICIVITTVIDMMIIKFYSVFFSVCVNVLFWITNFCSLLWHSKPCSKWFLNIVPTLRSGCYDMLFQMRKPNSEFQWLAQVYLAVHAGIRILVQVVHSDTISLKNDPVPKHLCTLKKKRLFMFSELVFITLGQWMCSLRDF